MGSQLPARGPPRSATAAGSYGFAANAESGRPPPDREEEEEKAGERGICGYCVRRQDFNGRNAEFRLVQFWQNRRGRHGVRQADRRVRALL